MTPQFLVQLVTYSFLVTVAVKLLLISNDSNAGKSDPRDRNFPPPATPNVWQETDSLIPSKYRRTALPWRLRAHDGVRYSYGKLPLLRSSSRVCRVPPLQVQVDSPYRSETAQGKIKRSYVCLRFDRQCRGQEMEELWDRRYSKKYDTYQATFLMTDTTALNRLKRDDMELFEQVMWQREGEAYLSALDGGDAISGNKGKQLSVKRGYAEKFGCDYNSLRIQPAQYTMFRPKECRAFFARAKELGEETMWIMKPVLGSGGVGISLHTGTKDFQVFRGCKKKIALSSSSSDQGTPPPSAKKPPPPQKNKEKESHAHGEGEEKEKIIATNKYIVQEYVKYPLLIHKKKFDMRVYLLIGSSVPYFVFYHKGYLRRAVLNYDSKSETRTVFLTNTHFQSLEKDFELADHIWGWARFQKYLADYNVAGAHYVSTVLDSAIKKVLMFNFWSAREELVRRKGTYHLFGLDFMIDDELRVHFIEANGFPGLTWSKDFPTRTMVTTMIDMIIELHESPTAFEHMTRGDSYGEFELIYNELEDQCSDVSYDPCIEFATHNTVPMKERARRVAEMHDSQRRTLFKAKKRKERDEKIAQLACRRAGVALDSTECRKLLYDERRRKFVDMFKEIQAYNVLNVFVSGM